MRITITGASGFVGRLLIPLLRRAGASPILVGRDPEQLAAQFPNLSVSNYENLAEVCTNSDAIVHLATRNNDADGTLEDFEKANVDLLRRVAKIAQKNHIPRIIIFSSLHVADPNQTDHYSVSKRKAELLVNDPEFKSVAITILRLPAVYGLDLYDSNSFSGRLSVIGAMPRFLRGLIFPILASFKPTVRIDRVADAILEIVRGENIRSRTVSDRQLGNWVYHAFMRSVDIMFIAAVILLLWWALLLAWLAVRLTSTGPGIFAQKRIGSDGDPFTCYKFRTMYQKTKIAGTHEVSSTSITRIGHFLRRTKFDEFPQIINILKNEMTLIGPRPCLPIQTELIDARRHQGVLAVKGGITGWAQIQNVDMSDPERLAMLEAEYLDIRTLPLDIKIILRTIQGSGRGDNVR